MSETADPLLSDLYQFSMLEAYLAYGENETAVFEFFVRRLPEHRAFLVAAGLEQALDFLATMHFSAAEIEWLASAGFGARLTAYLADFRFTGDVDAIAEGTVVFADEPILRVTAPLPQAQLVESRLINLLHFQTLIASKAARVVLAAPGKTLVDFGFRRAHGGEAGLLAARAAYLAGFTGTATVEAGRRFGIPTFGTMAHSFIEAQEDEAAAFERFARARPNNLTLLIDTYDTLAAVAKVVALAPRLRADGIAIRSVRIDSGDLIELSRQVRGILDAGGCRDIGIFVSGSLDEYRVAVAVAAGAPIDGFGVGTSLTTSSDEPALDCVYKLQEYAGQPRRKLSPGKRTWPGSKQVWRRYDDRGEMVGDTLTTADDNPGGEPLLAPVMKAGRRLAAAPGLAGIRSQAARALRSLPPRLRQLEPPSASYPVEVSDALRALAAETDARLKRR